MGPRSESSILCPEREKRRPSDPALTGNEGRPRPKSRSNDIIRREGGVRRPPGPIPAVAGRSSPYERLEKVTARRPERRADQYPPGLVPCMPGPHGFGPAHLSAARRRRDGGPRKVR